MSEGDRRTLTKRYYMLLLHWGLEKQRGTESCDSPTELQISNRENFAVSCTQKTHKNPRNLDLRPMTLIFSSPLEVVQLSTTGLHVHGKVHQDWLMRYCADKVLTMLNQPVVAS